MINNRTQRNSNIEFLRILAMFFIILSHFSAHGGFAYDTSQFSFNRLWTQFILLGSVGVDVFVIISGYFLFDSNKIKPNKLLKLWLQMFFYSLFLYVILGTLGIVSFTTIGLIKCFLPFIETKWWFANAYILLYMFHPLINTLVKQLDKRKHTFLIFICTIIWSVFPTFLHKDLGCNDFMWLVYLYLLACWIKKYVDVKKIQRLPVLLVATLSLALLFLSTIIIDFVGTKYSSIGRFGNYFYYQRSILILAVAVSLFFIFINKENKENRFINIIASTTFGIYLIHDYEQMRVFLWQHLFKNAYYSDSRYLFLYSIFVCVVVFLIAMLIEMFRQVVEKKCSSIINGISTGIETHLLKYCAWFSSKTNKIE